MPRLSSGYVIAGAYADKLRRTLFAQLRDLMRESKEWSSRIAYSAAQLNKVLFEILVKGLNVDRGDVVRIRIEYEVDEAAKEVKWKWDTLEVEVFRRENPEKVKKVVDEFKSKASEMAIARVAYDVVKKGETEDGDVVYAITLGGEEAGAVIVTPVNAELAVLKRGAVLSPVPAVFEKARLDIPKGATLESVLKERLSDVMKLARHVERSEAQKTVDMILSRIGVKLPSVEKIEIEEE